MDRRKFFGNLFGGVAAAAIAPELYAQILKQEYVIIDNSVPAPTPPERIFVDGEGLWVFHNGTLIGWGTELDISLDMHHEAIEVTSKDDMGWRSFLPGKPEINWSINQLRMENRSIFQDVFESGELVHLVFKTKEGMTVDSDALLTELGLAGSIIDNEFIHSASFKGVGEAIINYDEQDTDTTD